MRPQFVGRIACSLILALSASSAVLAQTPWETAPAKPASVQTKQAQTPAGPTSQNELSRSVQSLPPPPAVTSKPKGSAPLSSNVATPSYVPLTQPIGGQQSTSLVPAGMAIPTGPSNPNPSAGASAAVLPPLPTSQQLQTARQRQEQRASQTQPRNSVASGIAGNGASNNGIAATLTAFDSTNVNTGLEEFDAGQLIAVVGTDHILAGDMAVFVDPIIEKNRSRIRNQSQEDALRKQLIRQVLSQYVEIKAMYREFFRDMVGNVPPSEMAEMQKQVTTRAGKIFFEKQVPTLLEKYEVESISALEEKLREKSLSLVTLRSQFVEQVLAQELERKFIPAKYEIGRTELYDAYQEDPDRWQVPARARWRQLTIRFDRHKNDKLQVEQLIKQLGNEVYLGGKPFEAVAKQSSEGHTADEGGIYDWTSQGSLRSGPLDAAIFSLPTGRLSRVITDDLGMHIVEVIEREDGKKRSFADAQADLRKELSAQKRSEELKRFKTKVLARTPLWSLWPDDLKDKAPHVRPLSEALGS